MARFASREKIGWQKERNHLTKLKTTLAFPKQLESSCLGCHMKHVINEDVREIILPRQEEWRKD